jgi:hypothetical protein
VNNKKVALKKSHFFLELSFIILNLVLSKQKHKTMTFVQEKNQFYRIRVDFEYLQSISYASEHDRVEYGIKLDREYCSEKSKALFIVPSLITKVENMLRRAGIFFSTEKVWYRNNNVLTVEKFFN